MISCVSSPVYVIQQGICSMGNIDESVLLPNVCCLGKKLKNGGGSSPSCFSQWVKSIVRRLIRQGVPGLKRPTSNPRSWRHALSPELESAILPPGRLSVSTWSNPRRNVPDVITTALAGKSVP